MGFTRDAEILKANKARLEYLSLPSSFHCAPFVLYYTEANDFNFSSQCHAPMRLACITAALRFAGA